MAVPAINPIVEDVMPMAELHRLLHELVRPRDVRRAPENHRQEDAACDENQKTGETQLRKGVCAGTEDLRHRMLAREASNETGVPFSPRPRGVSGVKDG